jgi:hypothetical protein
MTEPDSTTPDQSSARLGPGTVAASLRPALSGGTELSLPPVGSIDAPTALRRIPADELRVASRDGDGDGP